MLEQSPQQLNVRILHCGYSTENYQLCIQHNVAGFKRRVSTQNDLIYLVVRTKEGAMCGARMILGEETDIKPWKDAEKYVQSRKATSIEFCRPFSIGILQTLNVPYWPVLWTQGAKLIRDQRAQNLLNQNFLDHK